MSSVRSQIEALGPATIQANFGLTPSRLLLGFAAGPRVFDLVQAAPIVVLIFAMFALLFAMAIIIAKPALEALLRQLIVVLNKIADLINEIIDRMKDAARQNLRQFQKCRDPFEQALALAAQILLELEKLRNAPPGDQLGRERAIRAIADKLLQLQALVDAFFRCMGLPPLGPLLP